MNATLVLRFFVFVLFCFLFRLTDRHQSLRNLQQPTLRTIAAIARSDEVGGDVWTKRGGSSGGFVICGISKVICMH